MAVVAETPGSALEQLKTIVTQFEELRSALEDSIAIIAWIAIMTAILVQATKLPLRYWGHFYLLDLWLRRRSQSLDDFYTKFDKLGVPEWLRQMLNDKADNTVKEMNSATKRAEFFAKSSRTEIRDFARYSLSTKSDFLLKQIENTAQEVLDRPSEHLRFLPLIAHGASVEDMVIVFRVDWLALNKPDLLDWLEPVGRNTVKEDKTSGDEPLTPRFPEALIAAQDNVAAAVERNLDDLQIRLTTWSPRLLRGYSVVVAIIIALWAWFYLFSNTLASFWILVTIGVAAGYLASLVYDLIGTVTSWLRPRR